MLELLRKIDALLYMMIKIMVVVFFTAMVLLITAQVYTRFLTTSSLTWSEELARYTMAYMVFLSAVLVARKKGHICIENLLSRLQGIPRNLLLAASCILQIIFFAIVLWGSWKMYPTAALRVSPALGIPMPYVYLCVPLSCLMMLIYNIRDFIELFISVRAEK